MLPAIEKQAKKIDDMVALGGGSDIVNKCGPMLDKMLANIDRMRFRAEDFSKWPNLREHLIQRRRINFDKATQDRNKEMWLSQSRKEMPAIIDHVQSHQDRQAEFEKIGNIEKFFNLSKNAKEDAPLTGFIEFYAYLCEERKYNLRYSSHAKGNQFVDLNQVLVTNAHGAYVKEKYYNSAEFFISEKQFIEQDWMNQVPEIVCDVLFMLSGFSHYRTNQIDSDVYKEMLMCQVNQ